MERLPRQIGDFSHPASVSVGSLCLAESPVSELVSASIISVPRSGGDRFENWVGRQFDWPVSAEKIPFPAHVETGLVTGWWIPVSPVVERLFISRRPIPASPVRLTRDRLRVRDVGRGWGYLKLSPSASNCFSHSIGGSRSRSTPMPRGRRPSTAALTRLAR